MEAKVGAALAAPPSADSAAKGYFKSDRSRRKKRTEEKTQKLTRKDFKELFKRVH